MDGWMDSCGRTILLLREEDSGLRSADDHPEVLPGRRVVEADRGLALLRSHLVLARDIVGRVCVI